MECCRAIDLSTLPLRARVIGFCGGPPAAYSPTLQPLLPYPLFGFSHPLTLYFYSILGPMKPVLKHTYFALRHAESIPNTKQLIVSSPEEGCKAENGLSPKGIEQATNVDITLSFFFPSFLSFTFFNITN
jgi:hypothetical protein